MNNVSFANVPVQSSGAAAPSVVLVKPATHATEAVDKGLIEISVKFGTVINPHDCSISERFSWGEKFKVMRVDTKSIIITLVEGQYGKAIHFEDSPAPVLELYYQYKQPHPGTKLTDENATLGSIINKEDPCPTFIIRGGDFNHPKNKNDETAGASAAAKK